MIYTKKLPQIKGLQQLAEDIDVTEDYPISGLGVLQFAEHRGYGDEVLNFLMLFSKKIIFISRNDFLQHCSLLEKLLREEKRSDPDEFRNLEED